MCDALHCFQASYWVENLYILGGEFLISNMGEITTTVTFDRESTDSYQLVIEVIDSGTTPSALTTTTTMTVSISGKSFKPITNKPLSDNKISDIPIMEAVPSFSHMTTGTHKELKMKPFLHMYSF